MIPSLTGLKRSNFFLTSWTIIINQVREFFFKILDKQKTGHYPLPTSDTIVVCLFLKFHVPCNSSFQSLSCPPSNNKGEKYTYILCHVWKIYRLLHTNIHTQPDTHTHILLFAFSNLTSSITQAVGSVHYLTYHPQIQLTLFPQQLYKNVLNKYLCNIFCIWKIIFRGSV